MKNKGFLVIVLVGLIAALALTSSASLASQAWKEGEVTKRPWTEQVRKIEVDGVTYSLMPQATLYRRERNSAGGYDEQPISLTQVWTGQKVAISVQGFRIYQLVVLR